MKDFKLSLALLIALAAIGCSPSTTPTGGAAEDKKEVTNNDSGQPEGAAQGAATLPPGVDPNGPMLTKPEEGQTGGEKTATGSDGGKSDEMRARMPGGNNPGGAGGGGGRRGMGLSSLVAMQAVKDELKLTNDQVQKLEAEIEEAREIQGTDRQKAQEQLNAAMKKILSAEQYKRIQELNYQRMGTRALTRPEVVKELALSEEQVAKIQAALEMPNPQGMQGGQGDQRPSEEEMRKMWENFQKAREEAQKKALAVLTPEQKKKWDAMLGKKFTFPQMGGPGGATRPTNEPTKAKAGGA